MAKSDDIESTTDSTAEYLVDFSKSELKIMSVWMSEYREQLNKGGVK